jgi:hypothetical protein
MNRFSLILLIILALGYQLQAQSEETPYNGGVGSGGYDYGLKGGLTIATQTWNNFQRNALFSYHGAVFFDVKGVWKEKDNGPTTQSKFGGQLGYHRKGSSFRNVFIAGSNNQPKNLFHNVSLTLWGKQAFKTSTNSHFYGGFGLRLDYTVDYELFGFGVEGVNRVNYGVWLAGGMEFDLSESTAVILELSVSPDLSNQVFVPAGYSTGLNDQNGNPILSQEQKVNNLIFEISAGFKIKQ